MEKLAVLITILLICGLAKADVCDDFSKYQFDSEYTEFHFAKICEKTEARSFNDYRVEKAFKHRLQKLAKRMKGEAVLEPAITASEDCNNKSDHLSNLTDLAGYSSEKVTIFNRDHINSVYKDGNYFNTTGLFQVSAPCSKAEPCTYYSNGTLVNIDSVDGMREHVEKLIGRKLNSNGVITVPMHSLYSSDNKCRKFPLNDMKIRFSDCPNGSCRHEEVGFSDALCSTSECVDQILEPDKDFCVLIPKKQPRNITPVNYSTKGIEEDGVTYVSGYSPYMIYDYLNPKGRTELDY